MWKMIHKTIPMVNTNKWGSCNNLIKKITCALNTKTDDCWNWKSCNFLKGRLEEKSQNSKLDCNRCKMLKYFTLNENSFSNLRCQNISNWQSWVNSFDGFEKFIVKEYGLKQYKITYIIWYIYNIKLSDRYCYCQA